jgi:hypothetical protein
MVVIHRGRRPSIPMLLLVTLCAVGCAAPPDDFPALEGPYLGQTPPGTEPQVFAPGIVSTGMYTRDVAITPDGTEFYFGVLLGRFNTILETHVENGRWTRPEVAPFARDSRFFHLEPAISPDGQRFFFLSTRVGDGREPLPEETRTWSNEDIWVMDRVDGTWSEPYNLGPPINTDAPEFFPSATRDGTLYFTRGSGDGQESHIYRSRLIDGRYQEPEKLGPEVNSTPSQFNAFIAPDERYLIICTGGREDSQGGTDYYAVFRTPEDVWSEPVNLGEAVNTPGSVEYSPYVSPDGKYFFFMSTRPRPDATVPDTLSLAFLRRYRTDPESGNAGIYWIDAGFIEQMRPDGW